MGPVLGEHAAAAVEDRAADGGQELGAVEPSHRLVEPLGAFDDRKPHELRREHHEHGQEAGAEQQQSAMEHPKPLVQGPKRLVGGISSSDPSGHAQCDSLRRWTLRDGAGRGPAPRRESGSVGVRGVIRTLGIPPSLTPPAAPRRDRRQDRCGESPRVGTSPA